MRLFDDGAEAFVEASDAVWNVVGQASAAAASPPLDGVVLDACAGAGASALPLARAVGPHGYVDAVDLSPRLTAYGTRAAHDAGLGNVAFHSADILDWAAQHVDSYDRIVCTLGLMFLPDPAAAMTAFADALRPGGRVTVTTWAAGAMQPLTGCLWQARLDLGVPAPPPAPFAASVTATEDPGRLLEQATAAGFAQPHVDVYRQSLTVNGEVGWALVTGTVLRGLITDLTETQLGQVRGRLAQGLADSGNRVDGTTLTLRAQRANADRDTHPGAPRRASRRRKRPV